MDGTKNYVVRYDVQAVTKDAVTNLTNFATAVNKLIAPLETLQKSASEVTAMINTLSSHSIKFTPDIDLTKFNDKADDMIKKAKTTAAQISSILRDAVSKGMVGTVEKSSKKGTKTEKIESDKVKITADARGNNGALTVIEQINTALANVKSQASFEIAPTINAIAFADVEAKLKSLVALSKSVMVPELQKTNSSKTAPTSKITQEQKKQLAEAQKQVQELNDKISDKQAKLNEKKALLVSGEQKVNKGSITRYENDIKKLQTEKQKYEGVINSIGKTDAGTKAASKQSSYPIYVDVIGRLTSVQNMIKEAIPVNVRISGDQINASLKAIPEPTLNVKVNFDLSGLSEQLNKSAILSNQLSKSSELPMQLKETAENVVPTPIKETVDNTKQKLAKITNLPDDILKRNARNKIRYVKDVEILKHLSDSELKEYNKYKDIYKLNEGYYEDLDDEEEPKPKRKPKKPKGWVPREEFDHAFSEMGRIKSLGRKRLFEETYNEMAYGVKQLPVEPAKSVSELVNTAAGGPTKITDMPDEKIRKMAEEKWRRTKNEVRMGVLSAEEAKDYDKYNKIYGDNHIYYENLKRAQYLSEKELIRKSKPEGYVDIPEFLKAKKRASELYSKAYELFTQEVYNEIAYGTKKLPGEPIKNMEVPVDASKNASSPSGAYFINIDAKLNLENVKKQIAELPRPTITVDVKLAWEDDITGLNKRLQEAASKVPVINVKLSTDEAVAKLNEFLAIIEKKNQQTISLIAKTSLDNKEKALDKKKINDSVNKQKKATVDIEGKINIAGIKEQIKNIPKQYVPMYIKLSWENGAVGKQEQYKKITGGLKPIVLKLDTTAAIAALQEFVTLVNSKSPQNIVLNASGKNAVTEYSKAQREVMSGKNIVPSLVLDKDPVVEKYNSQKEQALKNNAKKKADGRFLVQKAHEYQQKDANWHQYQQSLYDRLFGIPKYEDDWTVQAERKRADELVQMKEDARNAFSKLTPFEQSVNAARQKSVEESLSRHQKAAESLRTKALNSILPFADSKEQAKLMVENRKFLKDAMFLNDVDLSNYASYDTSKKLDVLRDARTLMEMKGAGVPMSLQNQIKKFENEIEQQKLMQRKQESANSIARHQKLADMLRAKAYNAFMPYVESKEQAKMMVENRKFFKKAADESGITPSMHGESWQSLGQKHMYLSEVANQMKSANKAVPWQLHDQTNKLEEQMRKVNKASYMKQKAEKSAASISRHAKQAQKLRADAYNAMLPFAENKEQVKTLVKYRKFFKSAMNESGIDVTPDMDNIEKLRYLKNVSDRMTRSKVEVPWQLQSQIKKITKQIDKEETVRTRSAGGGRGGSAYEKPFFDKSRKWAFPFTGPTSFGTNTPMAVEMAKGMGAAYAIEGAMSVIGGSFGQAVDYQNIMKTTQSILQNGSGDYTNESFRKMESVIRNVGVKTKFSAPEVANAAKFLAMAGYDINAINNSIRPIADLALIGDSDLGETADKMTNIMTTFQIAPEKMRAAANIMATTAMRSNTDLMMLAESAKYGGGVANLYGKNDPNLFADTMALFGVMGNAGIQASSAGTALRMMYQNIFNPNNKQKGLLNEIDKKYGIKTKNSDGGNRSMSEIITDIALKIPEKEMAGIVGKLFRITAQPGANAAILAAADAVVEQMSTKGGVSSLASLMKANRESVNGNISNVIAEDKQNTIQGLWAQVTSTFTEAILRSFESKKDMFENLLRQLRDYFAKPETLRTIQVFMDAIVDIGKTMASFAKIWADIYSTAPGLIATWIKLQLFFTQVGALISPLVSLIGVFDRLKGVIVSIAGASKVGAVAGEMSGFAQAVLATKEKFGAPISMVGPNGKQFSVRGGAAMRAAQEMKQNAQLAGELALSGAVKEEILENLNSDTAEHYAEVKRRANRRYGARRRLSTAFNSGRSFPFMATLTGALLGFKNLLIDFAASFVKVAGMIYTPIGGTIAVLSLLGIAFAGFYKKINGTFEYQLVLQEKLHTKSQETTEMLIENAKWYQQELDKFKNKPMHYLSREKSEEQKEYDERVETFRKHFHDIPNLMSDIDNKPALDSTVKDWRDKISAHPYAKFAFGDDYEKLVGSDLYDENKRWGIWSSMFNTSKHVLPVQQGIMQGSLRFAAADDKALRYVSKNIEELYKQYGDTEEFYKRAHEIRDTVADLNNPIWKDSSKLTLEQFNLIDDPTMYYDYRLGLYNIIDEMINGATGTIIGKMKAYKKLEQGVKQYSDDWWNAIGHVINDFPILFDKITEDGKRYNNVPVEILLTKDGLIDQAKLVSQMQKNIPGYQLNISDFMEFALRIFKSLAEKGLFKDSADAATQWLEKQLDGYVITAQDATLLYHNYLPSTNWYENGKSKLTLHEYQNYMTNNMLAKQYGAVNFDTEKEQQAAKHSLAKKMATGYYTPRHQQAIQKLSSLAIPFRPEVLEKEFEHVKVPKPTKKKKPDEDPYKSHYSSQSIRPTQISININELVHFDRTVVASSADEKDMIDAMENKITEAVYKIFAEASNQAQKVIDIN